MNTGLTVAFPTHVAFTNRTDIDKALQVEGVSIIVNDRMAESREVNVSAAMKSLAQVGSLLQLAYAGSIGFSCRRQVGEILINYQSLIKDSRFTSGVFVESCLAALKLHLVALQFAEKDKLAMGLKQIKRCGELAVTMAQASQTLVDKATALSELSKSAFLAAIEDSNATVAKKQEIQKMIEALEVSKAGLKSKTADLQEVIEEVREKEVVALKEAREARKNAFIISMVSAITQPLLSIGGMFVGIGKAVSNPASTAGAVVAGISKELMAIVSESKNEKDSAQQKYDEAKKQLAMKEIDLKNAKMEDQAVIEREIAGIKSELETIEADLRQKTEAFAKAQEQLNQQAKIAQDQAAGYAQIRRDLQKEKIEANASLAESVKKLQNLDINKNDLSRAIHSLELTIKTMAKIRTVFENTRLFWVGVKRRCDALTNDGVDAGIMSDFIESEMKDEFIASIKNSGFNWLALGKINLMAAISVEAVDNKVDSIMNDLPGPAVAHQLIQDISTTMLAQIDQETAALENNTNSNNNN